MNDELVEKYRAHISAERVEKWKYKEPFLELKLVFKVEGREQVVSSVIDLSEQGQVHLRLQEMRKQAHQLLKESK